MLKVAVHHGIYREMDPHLLTQFDIVITSYETLRSEHQQAKGGGLLG